MAGKRVHFVMPSDLVERIDAALSDGVSRGEFVRRAVERALGGSQRAASPTWDSPAWDPVDKDHLEPPRHAPNCKCPVCS